MKKKLLITFILGITIIFIYIILIQDRKIYITNEMKAEEGTIESAWDFKENLKIGWNLGMSLSANIPYPKNIKYKLILEDEDNNKRELNLFSCDLKNNYEITFKKLNNLKIEFDIPYTTLDGTLNWEIKELIINN